MDKYLNLFENYKKSRALEEADLKYLEKRLSPAELAQLEKQIKYLVLEAEEEAFFSALALENKGGRLISLIRPA